MQGGLVVDCGLRGNAGPRCIDRQEVADPLSFGKVGRQSQPRDGSRDDPLDRLAVAIRAILCDQKRGVRRRQRGSGDISHDQLRVKETYYARIMVSFGEIC